MLVLSRKAKEAIVINHNIRIVIVSTNGSKVKLGIEAPPEVPVHRSEVLEAIETADTLQCARPRWRAPLVV